MSFQLLVIFSSFTFTQAVTVCYGKFGCFSDDPPFHQPILALPSEPEAVGTTFRLYTRKTTLPEGEILDTANNSSISNSTLHSRRKVKFIVHGFMQDGLSPWVTEMRKELLKKENLNVIVVDWGLGARFSNLYSAAAGNTRLVGAQVADLIHELNSKFHVALKKFHIIGHSLGAHVAGFAGEKMVTRGKIISRITGLDPAGPGFDVDDAAARLDPSDAMFVDVIHSDTRTRVFDSSLGLDRASGHVDFYPNGGKQQPGCDTTNRIEDAVESLIDEARVSLPWLAACSHMKSVAYFTASINSPCAFTSFPCDNWQDFDQGNCFSCNGACPQMGYIADKYRGKKPVKVFLKTVKERPYCAGNHYYALTIYSKPISWPFFFNIFENQMKVTLTGDKGEVQSDKASEVQYGETSFVLSSARYIGKLRSVRVKFWGGFFLDKLTVYSTADNERYTATFKKKLGGFFDYFFSPSYTRKLKEEN